MSMYVRTGRRIAKSADDHRHLLPRVRAAASVTSRYWWTPPAYDQGESSMCVSYGGMRYLTSNPVVNVPFGFLDLYMDCLRNDEWDGEDLEGGTSVRALFKVLRRRGYIKEFKWAFSAEPVIDHLLTTGPVVIGTLWSPKMAQVTDDGYITVDRRLQTADGHCVCLHGANRRRRNRDRSIGAVRGMNSWGKSWGPDGGRFWLSFNDLDKLIRQDGEACVATEVVLPGGQQIAALEVDEQSKVSQ